MVESEAEAALAEASRRLKADADAVIAEVVLWTAMYRTLVEQADIMLSEALLRARAANPTQ